MKKQLTEVIKESVIKALNEARNKRGVINEFYKVIHPYSQGLFHDSGWENIYNLLDVMNEWADDFKMWVENGGYGKSSDGMSSYKDWQIEFIKDEVSCHGYVRAHAAGNVKNEWDRYDVSVIVW